MQRQLWVVTGSSRGLGAGIVAELMQRDGCTVIGIARGATAPCEASVAGATLESWQGDLADPAPVAERLERWLSAQADGAFASATLVNNAAVLTRVGALERCSSDELSRAARVGLEAPLVLSAAFLRATAAWRGERRVLHISSGLGRHAMAGQATYCAVKAGLDHMARAMALDQAEHARAHDGTRPARVASLAPGIIDTDMQVQLRGSGDEGFPDRGRFVEMQTSGALQSADATAARVIAYAERDDFGSNPTADIRDN